MEYSPLRLSSDITEPLYPHPPSHLPPLPPSPPTAPSISSISPESTFATDGQYLLPHQAPLPAIHISPPSSPSPSSEPTKEVQRSILPKIPSILRAGAPRRKPVQNHVHRQPQIEDCDETCQHLDAVSPLSPSESQSQKKDYFSQTDDGISLPSQDASTMASAAREKVMSPTTLPNKHPFTNKTTALEPIQPEASVSNSHNDPETSFRLLPNAETRSTPSLPSKTGYTHVPNLLTPKPRWRRACSRLRPTGKKAIYTGWGIFIILWGLVWFVLGAVMNHSLWK